MLLNIADVDDVGNAAQVHMTASEHAQADLHLMLPKEEIDTIEWCVVLLGLRSVSKHKKFAAVHTVMECNAKCMYLPGSNTNMESVSPYTTRAFHLWLASTMRMAFSNVSLADCTCIH